MKARGQNAETVGLRLVAERKGGERYEYYPVGKFVVIAPGICGGRPTFKGTRVEVQTVLDCLREERPINDILKSYPGVSRAGVQEAIRLAAKALTAQYTLKAA
jgi:uncharacterized protein (DUF433 family)